MTLTFRRKDGTFLQPVADEGAAATGKARDALMLDGALTIASPQAAASLYKEQAVDPVANVATTADDTPRKAWLGGAKNAYDPFILNWSGTLSSRYDWVALGFYRGSVGYVFSGSLQNGWQWATKGSPYVTSYSPYDISQRGGGAEQAIYFIWSAAYNMYIEV
ncbi:hypothetical protein [Burkholderia sp. 22PA0106]|uniref:hypothetical protein n=1 Tax=Burkholderia sp. 22PA0106 TaxID=3237371 RepID=UPI0039C201C4